MPHVDAGEDDSGNVDEIKVFRTEGGDEPSSETQNDVTEEHSDLIDLSESEEKSGGVPTNKNGSNYDLSSAFVKTEPTLPHMGYHLVSPYSFNGTTPVSMASKMGLGPPIHPGAGLSFLCHNGEPLTQPPPAHTGYNPYQCDPKGSGEYWRGMRGTPPIPGDWHHRVNGFLATGLSRPPLYPFPSGQYPYSMLSPEMSQVAATWHTSGVYPISNNSPGFRSPYPNPAGIPSDFYRFSPSGLLPGHPSGLSPHSHPAIVTPGIKQELIQPDINHRSDHKHSSNDSSKLQDSCHNTNSQDKKQKPHIKKPLNAFMLYMKEERARVVAECTLKESAAINQILGRKWHSLTRDEQAKYYEKARQERQLHMELYPGWSARDNYGFGAKKKKRKKERVPIVDSGGGNNMKKCRARYGLDQQNQWCKPCRRKKRCVRYVESGDSGNQSEENANSCGSAGDLRSPGDDDGESMQHSVSSPGGYSGLSSLTSPSVHHASPNTSQTSPSLASPCMSSLQSPLTPHPHEYDCPTNKPPPPPCLSLPMPFFGSVTVPQAPSRHPVGTNPHDINNPLSVNQLTGKCIKSTPSSSNISSSSSNSTSKDSRSAIQVT